MTNLAISHEIGKPTPVSPQKDNFKGVPPIRLDKPIKFTMEFTQRNFDSMALEIIRLRESVISLHKEISHYQDLYIQELESRRCPPDNLSRMCLTVTMGGAK
jgi:hypothetical protein